MKYLLSKERLRRENFKKAETRYLALKYIIHNQKMPLTFRWESSLLLSKISKAQSRVSLKNRCFLSGRGRGYLRFFNLSRIQFRDLARNNDLPFVLKSSW